MRSVRERAACHSSPSRAQHPLRERNVRSKHGPGPLDLLSGPQTPAPLGSSGPPHTCAQPPTCASRVQDKANPVFPSGTRCHWRENPALVKTAPHLSGSFSLPKSAITPAPCDSLRAGEGVGNTIQERQADARSGGRWSGPSVTCPLNLPI